MKPIAFSFLLFICLCNINACKQPIKNDKIKNGIEIYENGLHVQEAFLTNADSSYINDDNKVNVGDRVCLRMVIKGWKEKDGKVFMDASQTVSKSNGIH